MSLFTAGFENVARAAEILRAGGVVAFPTETVYGLGALAFNPRSVARIFEIKKRPHFDPLIVHVVDRAMLSRVVSEFPSLAQRLAEHFWPGPLTIVLPKAETVPSLVTAGLPTVGVRMPSHPVARALIAATGEPLAAPSANPFGTLSPTRASHVVEAFGEVVDLVIDGGKTERGIESTVVALEPEPTLLRPGAIGCELIEAVIGSLRRERTAAVLAPGQLPGHYAPRTPLRVIEPAGVPHGQRTGAGLLALSERFDGYAAAQILSPSGDLREAAARFFEALHELDSLGLGRIDAQPVTESGLGLAIMDRLRRAAYGRGPIG
jgi:L-threonylcarbamoyladenylate synthase